MWCRLLENIPQPGQELLQFVAFVTSFHHFPPFPPAIFREIWQLVESIYPMNRRSDVFTLDIIWNSHSLVQWVFFVIIVKTPQNIKHNCVRFCSTGICVITLAPVSRRINRPEISQSSFNNKAWCFPQSSLAFDVVRHRRNGQIFSLSDFCSQRNRSPQSVKLRNHATRSVRCFQSSLVRYQLVQVFLIINYIFTAIQSHHHSNFTSEQ